ncbi:MAG: MOSC domain-containing protein [Gammaproteobacteria bacterium]
MDWLGVRPGRRAPIDAPHKILVNPEKGIIGDRYAGRSGKRHLTLVQAEHLPVIAAVLQIQEVDPKALRRNIVVSGINLLALRKQHVRIGEVEIEVTGECHPCSYMEEVFGPGGYNAVRGHGGVTARVLSEGRIAIGDEVALIVTA